MLMASSAPGFGLLLPHYHLSAAGGTLHCRDLSGFILS